jgi:hypothetical protein
LICFKASLAETSNFFWSTGSAFSASSNLRRACALFEK